MIIQFFLRMRSSFAPIHFLRNEILFISQWMEFSEIIDYFLLDIKVKSVTSIEYYEAVRQIHATTLWVIENIIY